MNQSDSVVYAHPAPGRGPGFMAQPSRSKPLGPSAWSAHDGASSTSKTATSSPGHGAVWGLSPPVIKNVVRSGLSYLVRKSHLFIHHPSSTPSFGSLS